MMNLELVKAIQLDREREIQRAIRVRAARAALARTTEARTASAPQRQPHPAVAQPTGEVA